jgi:hypothetical protein
MLDRNREWNLVARKTGAPGANRTRDPLLRRQLLYPTELRAHYIHLQYITNEEFFDIDDLILAA